MVDKSRGIIVILVVLATLVVGCVVLVIWVARWRRRQRVRRLAIGERKLVQCLYAPPPWRRRLERTIVLLALGQLAAAVWGLIEANWLEVSRHEIRSTKLARGTQIRLVHISDLHVEHTPHLERDLPARIAALKPDLILFSGDAINETAGLPGFRQTMMALARIAPTFAVRGNWETWWFPNADLYGGTGVTRLDGRAQSVKVRGQTLCLLGVGVGEGERPPSVQSCSGGDSLSILLSHFSTLATRANRAGIDLMLVGDTHGGQARLPFLGELVRIKRGNVWYSAGLHRIGKMALYVNRGIGNEGKYPRFRFGCRPEIAELLLTGE